MKKNLSLSKKQFFAIVTVCIFCCSSFVYAMWVVLGNINYVKSTQNGSNNSVIHFSTWTYNSWTYYTKYANKDNDSIIIWDYLKWYYYDTELWFFLLDWDIVNVDNNIYFSAFTSKCNTWNWYKLSWYARWRNTWLINNLSNFREIITIS